MQQLLAHVNANTSIITESNQNQKAKSLNKLIFKLSKSDQFDSVISEYFPKTSSKYGKPLSRIKNNEKIIIKDLFGKIKTKPNKRLISVFKEIVDIENSTVIPSIRSIDLPNELIFTMVGVYSEVSITDLSAGHMLFSEKPRITGSKSINGKIILKNSTGSLIHPLVFFGSDLVNDIEIFTDNELRAIILHELGHWNGVAKFKKQVGSIAAIIGAILSSISLPTTVVSSLVGFPTIANVSSLIFIIGVLLLMLDNFFSRSEEFKADKFTKDLGFGKDLSNALRVLDGSLPINSKAELKKLATLSDQLSIFSDVLRTHPSTFRRSNRLLESSTGSFVEPKMLKNIAAKLDEQIARTPFVPTLAMFSR